MEINVVEPQKKETRKCYNCQKVGHLAVNCRSKKKNKKGKRKQLNTVKAQAGTAEPTEASVQRYTEQCSPDPVDEVDDV